MTNLESKETRIERLWSSSKARAARRLNDKLYEFELGQRELKSNETTVKSKGLPRG